MAGPALTCVGAIAGGFGVGGEVRLKSFCADPAAIAAYAPLVTEDGRSFGVQLLRPIPGAFAARLTGVGTREQAEALKGTRLYAPRDRLPPLPEDEYYHADLLGLAVVDPGGAPLGTVRAVLDHGAGDILEIVRPGAPDLLLPFTRSAVPTVDLAARRIVADPPEGLVEGGGRRPQSRKSSSV
jgi:16S rRNA processing protein RimM